MASQHAVSLSRVVSWPRHRHAVGAGAFQTRILTSAAAIRSAAEAWQELFDAAGRTATPFQHPGWALRCAEAMEAGSMPGTPLVVTFSRGGRLIFVAPLSHTRSFGYSRIEWMGGRLAAYGGVLAAPGENASSMLGALRETLRAKADILSLKNIRADSFLGECLSPEAFASAEAAPAIALSRHASFAHWEAARSKSTRRGWARKEKKLAELGRVEFSFAGTEGSQDVATLFAMKRAWADKAGILSRTLDDPAFEALVSGLVTGCDGIGRRLSVLRLDGRPIAMELGFAHAGRYHSYICAYDVELAEFSPGALQMRRTIEACYAQGIGEFDLMPPDDPYKREWATDAVLTGAIEYRLRRDPLAMTMARLHDLDLPKRLAAASPQPLRSGLRAGLSMLRPAQRLGGSRRPGVALMPWTAALSMAGAAAAAVALAD